MSPFRPVLLVRSFAVACALAGCAERQEYAGPELPPPPPPPPAVEPAPLPEPYTPPGASAAPPQGEPTPAPAATSPPPSPEAAGTAPSELVYTYPTGQWVYTVDHEWIWVPAGATPTEMEGVPYVFLYTATFGWTWYVSPWGWGPYHYGVWVRHPWHPAGWHGYWVAHPRVTVRLGPGRGRR